MTATRIFRRLAELLDVTLGSPSEGDVLTYASGEWTASAPEGGSQPGAVTLLGPFSVDFDTPNFFNPESGNGIATLTVPAGSIVKPFVIVTESFIGQVSGDEIDLGLAVDAAGSGPLMARYNYAAMTGDDPSIALHEPTLLVDVASGVRAASGFAVVECTITAVYWPAGATTITAGSLDVYAFVATPA